jgi:hypothetical protein
VKAFVQSTFQDTWAGRYASLAAAVAKRKSWKRLVEYTFEKRIA